MLQYYLLKFYILMQKTVLVADAVPPICVTFVPFAFTRTFVADTEYGSVNTLTSHSIS